MILSQMVTEMTSMLVDTLTRPNTMVTTAQTDAEAMALLKGLGLPFQRGQEQRLTVA